MNNSILAKLPRQLSKLMLQRTRVLSDKLWSVTMQGDSVVLQDDGRADKAVDIVILGKEHYNEQNRNFPIQSRRELNKILSLEAANSEGIMLYAIGDYIEGQRNVLCWTLKREVFTERKLKPLLIIPESALLLSDAQSHLYSAERSGRTFYFVRRNQEYLSAERKGLINNPEMFLASAGMSSDIARTTLEQDYAAKVTSGLLPLLSNFQGFNARLRTLESIDWQQHLKYSGSAVAAVLIGYFSLTSLYLEMRLESAKQTQSELSGQTKDVFQLQGELAKVRQKLVDLQDVTNLADAPNVIWRFLVPLMQKGVVIKQIGLLPSGLYVVTAEHSKSTEVLEAIKNDPLVEAPQFRGQTATVGDKERFSVAFKIKQEP